MFDRIKKADGNQHGFDRAVIVILSTFRNQFRIGRCEILSRLAIIKAVEYGSNPRLARSQLPHTTYGNPPLPTEKGENMAKNQANSNGKSVSTPRPVSPARLHQPTGSSNAFGGYIKVNHNNGIFSMRKTGK
jgi:hypothetical protein